MVYLSILILSVTALLHSGEKRMHRSEQLFERNTVYKLSLNRDYSSSVLLKELHQLHINFQTFCHDRRNPILACTNSFLPQFQAEISSSIRKQNCAESIL